MKNGMTLNSNQTNSTMTFKDLTFYSINDSRMDGSADLFQSYGLKRVGNPVDANILVFNGGSDIGTSIYGEKPIARSGPLRPSVRDYLEIELYERFPQTFKIGICRGAQFLNCMNGGTLWQDVDNHGRDHMMTDLRTGEKILVTSTHHQMMRPNYKAGKIIGVADEATRKVANPDVWDARGGVHYPDDHKDTEIVWYPGTRSLCVQGHPEYVPHSRFARYFFELVSEFMQETHACVD